MSRATWADVEKGDVVTLDNGREWRVLKLERKRKTVAVKVEHNGRTAEAELSKKTRVKIAKRAAEIDPVQDAEGAQRRWAKPKELEAVLGQGLGAGDPSRKKPPAKPVGPAWDEKHGKKTAEGRIEKILGATLVAETKVEAAGYYVPPVDVSTVAAHLALMHGGIPEACGDEGAMIRAHDSQHAEAKKGAGVLAVNHWHTERRP